MRLKTPVMWLLPLFIIVAGAFGQEIHYAYDCGAQFAAYKSYQWIDAANNAPQGDGVTASTTGFTGGASHLPTTSLDLSGSGSEDRFIESEIRRAVDEQLAKKGLTRVEKNGDVLVAYRVALHHELSMSLFGSAWRQRTYGGWPSSFESRPAAIPLGTVVVDLYDHATNRLIWRGGATKSIQLTKDPDKSWKHLDKAMAKLFKDYPPQPGK